MHFSLQKLPFIRRTRVAHCSSYHNQNINNLIKKESPKLKVVTNDQCLKKTKIKKEPVLHNKIYINESTFSNQNIFFCL